MPHEAALKDDAELLKLSANGSTSDFEAFVERHEAPVLRYIRALVHDDMAAADVFQETFVAAWRNAASFQGEHSARAWVIAIARNAAHRQFRRKAGEPAQTESFDELAELAGWGHSDRIAERFEATELVRTALGRLQAEDREVLLLRDVEEYSGEDVARMLGLTLPAMKSRLHRARLRFMAAVREIS